MNIKILVKSIFAPFRLKTIRKFNSNKGKLRVLDVGCGNNSCELTKQWLTVSEYHGIDKEFWHGHEEDYKKMDKVFYIDIEQEIGSFSQITNEHYDVIILSHIIEHIKNGYDVIEALLSKLKKGGLIYIEAPHSRTLSYPPADGFLNFNDEPTHKMVYDYYNVSRLLMKNDLTVMRAGNRRDLVRLFLFSPAAIIINLFYYLPFKQRLYATGLWDLLGVAFFVVAKK